MPAREDDSADLAEVVEHLPGEVERIDRTLRAAELPQRWRGQAPLLRRKDVVDGITLLWLRQR